MTRLLVLLLVAFSKHSVQQTILPECSDADRDVGTVRLGGSQYQISGVVEVCTLMGSTLDWATVCTQSWVDLDAKVVCRELGFSELGATAAGEYLDFFPLFSLTGIACTGDEQRLADCPRAGFAAGDCGSYNHAIAQCNIATCQQGDVRLVDGNSPYSGRVEVCLNEQWGTVLDSGWSTFDAHVVCQQLGLIASGTQLTEVRALGNAHFGRGTGPIHLNRVVCFGSESELLDCQYGFSTPVDLYDHRNDAGVDCSNGASATTSVTSHSSTNTTSYFTSDPATSKPNTAGVPTATSDTYTTIQTPEINSLRGSRNTTEMTGSADSSAVFTLAIICGILVVSLLAVLAVCITLTVMQCRLRHKGTHTSSPTLLSTMSNEAFSGSIENPQYSLGHTPTNGTSTGRRSVRSDGPQYYEIPIISTPPQGSRLYDTVGNDPEYSVANRGEPQPYEIPLGNHTHTEPST